MTHPNRYAASRLDDSYLVFNPVEEWHAIRAEKAAKRREFWRNAAGIAITTALLAAITLLVWL